MAEMTELFNEAEKYIPGGVNSPVRSFKTVGSSPVFIKCAKGSKIYAECGKEFIDYCLSWGAMILGHAHPAVIDRVIHAAKNGTSFGAVTRQETELARIITEAVPSIEQVRLTNSGTEAVMGAIRLARAFTGRNKIIKFDGAYHGHADYLLDSAGVPADFTKHTVSAPYNDIGALESAVERCAGDLAAIIVEPVAANCGLIEPEIEFLNTLRQAADRRGAILIFDEVITGFRLSYGGAQEYFKLKPDITCLGKIIGGGLPVGAFGGRREIMRLLAPSGNVYQAGTLSGNPVAVAAGIATLRVLKEKNPYGDLALKTENICRGIEAAALKSGLSLKANRVGSLFNVFFTDIGLFKRFFHGMLKNGIYLSPSGFEVNFLSTAHSDEDIERTLKIIEERSIL